MATPVQLAGGAFQDSVGEVLASGYLQFELSQDAQANGTTQVAAGEVIRVLLDVTGNVAANPAQTLWANDALSPANTFYNVSAFTAAGQLVWGPNAQQVLSSPSPFNVGAWVPGSVNVAAQLQGQLAVNQATTYSTASAGSATLPGAPAGFVTISINGTNYKVPYYGI